MIALIFSLMALVVCIGIYMQLGRLTAELDRKERAQREGELMIQESIEAYEANDNHRTINDILELGK
ncbi:hypothetical protein RKLH11_4147 [Rhodobacteraceae bacterium KLH11]|nr:hypothetical protein RKLH11_4147 [Rhodobacteraceae bacterium KLH11]